MRQMWLVFMSQPDNKPHLDFADIESDQFTRPGCAKHCRRLGQKTVERPQAVLENFRSPSALGDLIRSALGAEPSNHGIAFVQGAKQSHES